MCMKQEQDMHRKHNVFKSLTKELSLLYVMHV